MTITWDDFRHPALTSPLHLAVFVRAGLYDESAMTGSEIAEEMVARGWCTPEEFHTAFSELREAKLIRSSDLVPNPNRHTGPDCVRCQQHQGAFSQAQPRYERARARWEAGPHAYPYVPSSTKLHRVSCRRADGMPTTGPTPPAATLREFAHPHERFEQRRYVPAGWPDDGLRAYEPLEQLSVREAREWILARTGPQGGRYWKPCQHCRPIDPFLIDLPDEDITYIVPGNLADPIVVTINDVTLHRLVVTPNLARLFHDSTNGLAGRAYTILCAALGGFLANQCRVCDKATRAECGCLDGWIWLPYKDFTTAHLSSGTDLRLSRAAVRQWLQTWYEQHHEVDPPAHLDQILDRDLALRTDLPPTLLLA